MYAHRRHLFFFTGNVCRWTCSGNLVYQSLQPVAQNCNSKWRPGSTILWLKPQCSLSGSRDASTTNRSPGVSFTSKYLLCRVCLVYEWKSNAVPFLALFFKIMLFFLCALCIFTSCGSLVFAESVLFMKGNFFVWLCFCDADVLIFLFDAGARYLWSLSMNVIDEWKFDVVRFLALFLQCRWSALFISYEYDTFFVFLLHGS